MAAAPPHTPPPLRRPHCLRGGHAMRARVGPRQAQCVVEVLQQGVRLVVGRGERHVCVEPHHEGEAAGAGRGETLLHYNLGTET